MVNVILYTRVSTDEQAEKGFSLRDQKEKLERFADANGYTVVQHFQDDHSAKTFDRPAFNKLLAFSVRLKLSHMSMIPRMVLALSE